MKNLKTILIAWLAVSLLSCGSKDNPTINFIASDELKKANLPFSEAVVVDNVIYLSGQIGSGPDVMKLVEGGIQAEAEQALENIKNTLERNGSSLENVVKCTVMLADIAEWAEFNKVYMKYFPNNKPARSAFATNGLALGARVEIECIAVMTK